MDFKEVNIDPIDKSGWEYILSGLKEVAPLLGWVFGVLAVISLVALLLSKNAKNVEKKEFMNYLFSLFLPLLLV